MNYRAPSIARLLAIGCQNPDIVRAIWKCEKRHQLDDLMEGKMAEELIADHSCPSNGFEEAVDQVTSELYPY